MERSALQGLAAFRWGAWLWMATVLLVSGQQLERPWLAVGLVGLALAVTFAETVLLRTGPDALLRTPVVATELAVGAVLILCDGVACGPGHAFSTSQSLGSVWPLTGLLVAGVAWGPVRFAGTGVALGVARVGVVLANGASIDTGGRALSVMSSIVISALGGAAAGYLAQLLGRAEAEISAARAREEVARTLHDGVLQTLAVVERRASDPALSPGWRGSRSGSCATGFSGRRRRRGWSPTWASRSGCARAGSRSPSRGGLRSWWPTTSRLSPRSRWPPSPAPWARR